METTHRFAALLACALALAGCTVTDTISGSLFGVKELDRDRAPSNATEYLCDGGKSFYLRLQDGGASAWVILSEREFRLDQEKGSAGTRYASRAATLELKDGAASLVDAPDVSYTGCKPRS